MKDIMLLLKECTEKYRVPIILVSQLKKKSNKREMVPNKEDIKGFGIIMQTARTALVIAPWVQKYEPNSFIKPTIFRVIKGENINTVGVVEFDAQKNEYAKEYTQWVVGWDKEHGVEMPLYEVQ